MRSSSSAITAAGIASAAGAAVAFALWGYPRLAPKLGGRRRARLLDRIGRAWRQAQERTRVEAQHLAARASESLAEVPTRLQQVGLRAASDEDADKIVDRIRSKVRSAASDEDADKIVDRIRSKIQHIADDASQVDIDVSTGRRVVLAGRCFADEAPKLVAAVRKVKGVSEVEDRLERVPDVGEAAAVVVIPEGNGRGSTFKKALYLGLGSAALGAGAYALSGARQTPTRRAFSDL